MNNQPTAARAVIGCALVFTITIAMGTLLVCGHFSSDPVGPQDVFERHLMALDDQDWELANTYVTEWCQSDLEGVEAAGRGLEDSGFSFYRAFAVEEVWISEDGLEALLGLDVSPNLPLPRVATMERVDGEWLVSCG